MYLYRRVGITHRHPREIDCSSAVVGMPATGTESRDKSIHWTRMWCQRVLHSGCCGWRNNYYSQQRQAGCANEQSTSLRCLWNNLVLKSKKFMEINVFTFFNCHALSSVLAAVIAIAETTILCPIFCQILADATTAIPTIR